jgi:predicted  nucleic acid-binding Zn-ribbon protein
MKPMNILENLLRLQDLESKRNSSRVPNPTVTQLRSQLSGPILAHYDRFVARGKTGVAIVQNQVCGGCHMQLPLGTLNALLHAADIQVCDNCGRYLYLPQILHAEGAPASLKATSPKLHV